MKEEKKLEARAKEFLKERERVSFAELQYILGCTYLDAAKLTRALRDEYIISGEDTDAKYYVNIGLLTKKELDISECIACRSYLSDSDVAALESLSSDFSQGGDKSKYKRLISVGLVGEFSEKYFTSVTASTINTIKMARLDRSEFIIERISKEAAELLKKGNSEYTSLLGMSFIPKTVKDKIAEYSVRYKGRELPKLPVNPAIQDDNLKYLFFESFFVANDFDNVLKYREIADSEVELLRSVGLDSGELYSIISTAAEDIKALSLENIRDLRSFLI